MTPQEYDEYMEMQSKLLNHHPSIEDKAFLKRYKELESKLKLTPEQKLLLSMAALLKDSFNRFGAEEAINAFFDCAKRFATAYKPGIKDNAEKKEQ